MNIMVIGKSGTASFYNPADLKREARIAVKGKGKLTDYFVQVDERNGQIVLVAQYALGDGWQTQTTVAL